MNGLLKNNFYAVLPNVKWFSAAMIFLGLFVIAADNDIPNLLIGYMLLSMVGFPINGIASMRREGASKWQKYKLTTPVRRKDIVTSYFLNQLVWMGVGMLFAAVCVSFSVMAHGFPFDQRTDILMLFTAGVSVSLLTSAAFFVLSPLGGDERNEVILIISLINGIGVVMGLVSFINWMYGPELEFIQIVAGAALILICALCSFVVGYFLTVGIYKRKDF